MLALFLGGKKMSNLAISGALKKRRGLTGDYDTVEGRGRVYRITRQSTA